MRDEGLRKLPIPRLSLRPLLEVADATSSSACTDDVAILEDADKPSLHLIACVGHVIVAMSRARGILHVEQAILVFPDACEMATRMLPRLLGAIAVQPRLADVARARPYDGAAI